MITPKEFGALLRTDFPAFIHRAFYELNPQARFIDNWHISLIASKLEALRRGEIHRLIINLPPRHLKSLCASIAFPAWLLGHDPTAQMICVSYGQDLADKLARDTRAVMGANWYRTLFATRLSPQKQSVEEFVTTRRGFRLATSVGGVLTGRGADFMIIDDAHKPEEAISDTRRKAANEWYDNTLYSRLNDKATGRIVIIMQRLHEDDLVGHVLRQEGWEVVSLPAIAHTEESFLIETPFGSRRIARRPGDLLHPKRESQKTLDQIRRTLGEYNFAGQYLQTPAPIGGGLVKSAWFKRYRPGEEPGTFDQVVQSWDTANKPTELSDYSVCTTWGVKGPQIYLLNVFRRQFAYPDLKRAVREQASVYRPGVILIEDKASGIQLIQELIEEGAHQVTRFKPEGDKTMRFNSQTAVIENGYVHIPEEAHWLGEYLLELTTFPNAKYDDQADSTSQALAWLKVRPAGWGWLELANRELEARRVPQIRMSRLKAPVGISHVYTIVGRQLSVGNDRTIEVTEEEAKPLFGAGFTLVEENAEKPLRFESNRN